MTDVIRCEIRNTQILRYNDKKKKKGCNTQNANIISKATFLKPFSEFHLSLLRSHAPFNYYVKNKDEVVPSHT
jgi:hypothetical protein